MIKNTAENQTQFMEDQALWQHPASVQTTQATQETQPEQSLLDTKQVMGQKKKITPKRIMLIAAGMIVALSIVLLLIAEVGRKNIRLIPELSPSPLPITDTISDFDKAMNRLNQDVIVADPTVNDLPFPPLNPELYIVPKRN